MSNALAIATVTAALKGFLQETAAQAVPGAEVTTLRPQAMEQRPADSAAINIYLYQIVPNAALRTADLPTRRSDGTVIQRPQSAWDLHYLLSFYGSEIALEEQRLLGSTVDALHAQPFLNRDRIRATASNPNNQYLANSNLAEQVESLKFTPLSLNLEEFSKVWSIFFQTSYSLSLAYQASVVLIESEEIPQPVLPVRERNIYLVGFRQPVIARILSQAAAGEPILANQPILSGYRLILEGQQLRGDMTQVRLGQVDIALDPASVSDTRISFVIPATVKAGVQGIQVVHLLQISQPPRPYRYVESNAAALLLRPRITGDIVISNLQGSGDEPRSATLTVPTNPAIGTRQRVVLLLNERAGAAPTNDLAGYSFAAPPPTADTTEIDIPVQNVKAGTYLVRLQVDGAESLLAVDTDPNSPTFNQYAEPSLTIP